MIYCRESLFTFTRDVTCIHMYSPALSPLFINVGHQIHSLIVDNNNNIFNRLENLLSSCVNDATAKNIAYDAREHIHNSRSEQHKLLEIIIIITLGRTTPTSMRDITIGNCCQNIDVLFAIQQFIFVAGIMFSKGFKKVFYATLSTLRKCVNSNIIQTF